MTQRRPLSWLDHLSVDQTAALLANPTSPLPTGLTARILGHAEIVEYFTEDYEDGARRCQLHPVEVKALEEERVRLDDWWNRRSEAERAALIAHRASLIPGECREAVKDLMPDGLRIGDDFTGPFTLPKMVAAYAQLMARQQRG